MLGAPLFPGTDGIDGIGDGDDQPGDGDGDGDDQPGDGDGDGDGDDQPGSSITTYFHHQNCQWWDSSKAKGN